MPRLMSFRSVIAIGLIGGVVSLVRFGWNHGSAEGTQARSAYAWTEVTPNAEWEPGYSFSTIAVNDSLLVFGHAKGDWISGEGRTWTNVRSDVDHTYGYDAFVAFNSEVYAVGGTSNRSNLGRREVWKSRDRRHWTLLTDRPEWSARVWHGAVVFKGQLWVIGGYDGDYRNDVWRSADGIHWEQVIEQAPWRGRGMHATVVFDGKIWVLGGRRDMDSWWETDFNDVWYSSDGREWIRATASAGWSKRYGMAAVVWDGKLWVMGGSRIFRNNEVWSSQDGAHWTQIARAGWSPRFAFGAAPFRNGVWVMGGKEGGGRFRNDVWLLTRVE
jgi:hypothetical protein